MRVVGLDAVPRTGALLIVPNHDSQMDPVVLGIALRKVRPLRYLARANLWKIRGLGPIMYGLRQIPVERGAGDMAAIQAAVDALRAGQAVCIFPEGKLSRGERLRARSGLARLRAACPGADRPGADLRDDRLRALSAATAFDGRARGAAGGSNRPAGAARRHPRAR